MRHALGLRNSSNPVEKANDILVASRQKHRGMSWSRQGSWSLAEITAVFANGEMKSWYEDGHPTRALREAYASPFDVKRGCVDAA